MTTDYSNLDTTSYERPVKAKLCVHLDNGEIFDATPEDLSKFGYVSRLGAYVLFNDTLTKALMKFNVLDRNDDLTDTNLNPLRYLIELVLCYPDLLDSPETQNTLMKIAELEKKLDTDKKAVS